MKSFSTYITELEQDWERMKKPKQRQIPAVDDYGRVINTPDLPKKVTPSTSNKDLFYVDPDKEPKGVMNKNWKRLQDAPPGTEERAEYKMRREYGSINMLPRRVGPEMNPETEQMKNTVDHSVLKRDTQDQMPEINVDEPPLKKRKRT